MRLPAYLVGLVLASLLASACLVAILIYLDPFSSGLLIFLLLYLTLCIGATGFFTIIGWLIRRFPLKRKIELSNGRAIRYFEVSFRQGLFLSSILVTALILQSQRMLTWWSLLIIIILVGLAEWWLARR